MVGGQVGIIKNDAGGILGGISTGAGRHARIAFKPTSSIAAVQQSVNLRTGGAPSLPCPAGTIHASRPRRSPSTRLPAACALLDSSWKRMRGRHERIRHIRKAMR